MIDLRVLSSTISERPVCCFGSGRAQTQQYIVKIIAFPEKFISHGFREIGEIHVSWQLSRCSRPIQKPEWASFLHGYHANFHCSSVRSEPT